MNNNILIVAHGDLDGIVSAALLAEQLGIDETDDLNVVFTQPFLLDKVVVPDEIDEVYVVDIARNRDEIEMTQRFYDRLGDRLVRWYDHHLGWENSNLTTQHGGKVIAQTARACAVMLGHSTDIRVINAIVADTRKGELQLDGALIDEAIKSDMRNDEIRFAAVKLLMGDESQRQGLEIAAKAYIEIQARTVWITKNYMVDDNGCPIVSYTPGMTAGKAAGVDYKGNIAFIDVPELFAICKENGDYDLTQLLLAGQELATFAVAKTISPDDREMVTIATKSKTNLVELFGLPSGASFRVSLPASQLEEVMEKLRNCV